MFFVGYFKKGYYHNTFCDLSLQMKLSAHNEKTSLHISGYLGSGEVTEKLQKRNGLTIPRVHVQNRYASCLPMELGKSMVVSS